MGGLGFPKLATYYEASILESAIRIQAPRNTFQWADMEQEKFSPHLMLNILWSPKLYRPKKLQLYPTTRLTIQIWDKLLITLSEKGKFCIYAPLEALEGVSDWLSLKPWATYGVKHIKDLCSQTDLMAFPTLQTNYKIPNSFMFQYIQLKSIVHTRVTLKLPTTPPKGTHTLTIITRCLSAPTKPKSLSLCYKTLLSYTPPHAFNYVKQWGKDNIPELTDSQWFQSLNALRGLTSCFSHVE
ncbi:Hypothetical predicted protein, partial [Pelobates cultripes]